MEKMELFVYKDIPYEEGFVSFQQQMKIRYPETKSDPNHFVFYRWDSILYDFIFRDQMKVLDSMAPAFGNKKIDFVFVTEMQEEPSKQFLKDNYDAYKHVKMLYGMDDFISGLHNSKAIKIAKPTVIGMSDSAVDNRSKQSALYLITDSRGKILVSNKNYTAVLKDTAFLNTLNRINNAANY